MYLYNYINELFLYFNSQTNLKVYVLLLGKLSVRMIFIYQLLAVRYVNENKSEFNLHQEATISK